MIQNNNLSSKKTALDIHGKAKFFIKKTKISHFSVILTVEHRVIGSSGFEIWNVRLFTAHATVALRRHFREKKKYLCCVLIKLYNSNEVTFVH